MLGVEKAGLCLETCCIWVTLCKGCMLSSRCNVIDHNEVWIQVSTLDQGSVNVNHP